MKKIYLLALAFITTCLNAQNPLVIKTVGSTVTEPNSADQEGWKNNEWNGLFFYQGKGSPTKLCVTDGTNAGTQYLADIGSGSIVTTIPAQNFMYIITNRLASFSPFTYEAQIWKTNGTTAGTVLVKTMPQIVSSTITNIWTSDRDTKRNFSVIGDVMYFGGYDATNGVELWKTDGTISGTVLVKDINAGTSSSSPMAFCKIGTSVYFSAVETSGRKLWKTDGTLAGTVQIAVAEPFFILDNAVGFVNNKMIFYAHNTVDGYEPYVSDGTAAGTFMLKNINTAGNSWITVSQNAHLRFNTNYCFFIANNGTANALWRTDGTSAGTIQLTDNALAVSSDVSGGSYTDIDNAGLWMIQYNSGGSGNNEKLYKSDGTPNGTYLAAQNLSYAQYIKIYKNALWMQSRDMGSAANTEPWRCGGNIATTNKAMDIAFLGSVITYSSDPFGFFVKNNKLHFFATPINGTMNLYQYNGDFTYNGSLTGGRWRDSANWNSMMPPGITDTVYINTGTANALNIDGQKAYAGILQMQAGTTINFTNATDSLFVNSLLSTSSNNSFTGNGVLAFRNNTNNSVQVNNGFTANNLSIQSNANLQNGTITINGLLNLNNNAKLTLNNNNLVLAGNTSSATGSATSYIVTNGSGKLTVQNVGSGARTGTINYPIGTVDNYNPVQLSNAGTADNFSIRVQPQVNAAYTGEVTSGNPYFTNAVDASWFITEGTAGGSNATINLQWNAAQELLGFNRTQSRFGHYNGGSWQLSTAGAASGSDPYTFTGTGYSSFSPFSIFNSNAAVPINSVKLFALKDNRFNKLSWNIIATNANSISIENSTNGLLFSEIQVLPFIASSSYNDVIHPNNIGKIYYRIKVIDKNGQFAYSNIVSISNENNEAVTVYPTVVQSNFTVQNNSNAKMALRLYNASGKLVYNQVIISGTNIISLGQLASGNYFYTIYNKNELHSNGSIIKQ